MDFIMAFFVGVIVSYFFEDIMSMIAAMVVLYLLYWLLPLIGYLILVLILISILLYIKDVYSEYLNSEDNLIADIKRWFDEHFEVR